MIERIRELHLFFFFLIIVNGLITSHAQADSVAGDFDAVKQSTAGVIDGNIGGGEYTSGPFTIEDGVGTNIGTFWMQTYKSGATEEIQMHFTITDISNDPDIDQIAVSFDTDHSHTTLFNDANETDRTVRIIRQISGGGGDQVLITQMNTSGTGTTISTVPGSQWSVVSTSNSWTAEVKIDSSDLSLGYIPSIIGAHVNVTRAASATNTDNSSGTYPLDTAASVVDSWANIRTRNPINYALVLDKSGSMSSSIDGSSSNSERWNTAIIASEIFTQMYHAYSVGFNDRVGILTFTTSPDCSGAISVGRVTGENFDILSTITVDAYVETELSAATPGGCTPIKDGLNAAFDEMNDHTGGENIALLLSDGFHNRPTYEYDDEPYNYNGSVASDFEVNTVALESTTDTSADTGLMHEISLDFDGFSEIYHDATSKEETVNAFADILGERFYVNQSPINGSGEFIVNAGEPNLVVMLVWLNQTGSDRNFRIKPPSTDALTTALGDATYPTATYHHYRNDTAGIEYEIAYYKVDNPEAGTWVVWRNGADNPLIADNNFAFLDPTVYARFKAKRIGETVLLTASLKEYGKPIISPDANVTVRISEPGEGLGTFVSNTNALCNLDKVPVLPDQKLTLGSITLNKKKKGFQPVFLEKKFLAALTSSLNLSNTGSGQTNSTDPLPSYIVKLNMLLATCNKNGLLRENSSEELYDDGTHGDLVASDGIHSLLKPAPYEGTIILDFFAKGLTPMGSNFARVRKFSIHKTVAVIPEASLTTDRILFSSDGYIIKEYGVIPRDSSFEYLGPGHKSEVKFIVTGGKMLGGVNDYLNGVYTQLVYYNSVNSVPKVTPVVQGKPFSSNACTLKCEPDSDNSKWSYTTYIGITYPDGTLDTVSDSAYSVAGQIDYRLNSSISLGLLLAYDKFDDTIGASDPDFLSLSPQIRYHLPAISACWNPYVVAGFGLYDDKNSNTELGYNAGVGLTHCLTNRVALDGRVDYHSINSGVSKYTAFRLGLRWLF